MSGEKISHVIKTIKFLISKLQKKDRVCIITYSDSVELNLPFTLMDSEGKIIACKQLENIKTGGCKDIFSGLRYAVEMMNFLNEKNEVSSILLFTDGISNQGVNST